MVNTVCRKVRSTTRHRASCSPEVLGRVRDWMEREIQFVANSEFLQPNFARQLESQRPDSLDLPPPPRQGQAGLAFVTGLVEAPLLSHDEELYLFTRMNYLRFCAGQCRNKLELNRPDESLVVQLERDLAEATEVRNRIVRSNLRLLVAVARKLATSIDQMSELIGEATVPLIRAVELFNVTLGNRFSTYATWAIRNHMIRCLKRRQSVVDRTVAPDPLWLDRLPDQRISPEDDTQASAVRAESIQQLLKSLSERERLVISARFGLDGQPRGQSLQDIALRVGLSKERVRQIAISAIEKLRGIVKTADGE
jgi:RNA polymerase primary sigma factor